MMAPSRKPPNLTASTLPNLYALIKGSARIVLVVPDNMALAGEWRYAGIVMANTPLVLLRGGR